MRLQINIHPKTGELSLPENYQRALSAAIWTKIEDPTEKEGTHPKLITFSSLLFQKREKTEKGIRLTGNKGTLLVASPLEYLFQKTADIKGDIEIAGNLANVGEKSIVNNPDFTEEMTWVTLPGVGICTKTTKTDSDKCLNPKTHKEECEALLLQSLLFKWKYFCEKALQKAICWCGTEDPIGWAESNLPQIEILTSNSPTLTKIRDQAQMLSWSGKIKITGHTAWQRMTWDCGLGTKTGLGCGMVEPSKKQ